MFEEFKVEIFLPDRAAVSQWLEAQQSLGRTVPSCVIEEVACGTVIVHARIMSDVGPEAAS